MNTFIYIGALAAIVLLISVGLYLIIRSKEAATRQAVTNFLTERENDFVREVKNRYVRDHINIKAAKILDDNYKYSRFYKTKLGERLNTSYSYFLTALTISLVLGVIAFVMTRDVLNSFLIVVLVFSLFYLYLFSLRVKNNKVANRDLPLFLNLLGNFSTGNSEITSIMLQIAPRVGEPLSSCLMEFVAESQNGAKGKVGALENLANKIDNEKYREIIYSIILAESYSGSFKNVAVFNKRTVNDYLVGKKKKKQMVTENAVVFTICIAMLIVALFIVGQVLNMAIFAALISTHAGRLVLGIVIGTTLYFIYKLMEAGL